MSFADEVAFARNVAHEELGMEAFYQAPGPGRGIIPTHVRLIRHRVLHGDLDRQGFAAVEEDVNKVILDTTSVGEPLERASLNITGLGLYRIDTIDPEDGRYRACNVIRVPK